MGAPMPESLPWAELLGQLRETPDRLRELTTGVDRDVLCTRSEPATWSPCETIGHMCAAELPFRACLLRIVLEDNPSISDVEETTEGFEPDTPVDVLLDTLGALRADTIAFLESLPPSARGRPAQHATGGPTTLRGQVEALLLHDIECLEALAREVVRGR